MPFPTRVLRASAPSQIEPPKYRSPYGPKYSYQLNLLGMNQKQIFGLGLKSGAFGAVALFTVIFYASGIPRVQRDILQKVPFLGSYFVREIHPKDNPF